jgi:hypothetical protein
LIRPAASYGNWAMTWNRDFSDIPIRVLGDEQL